MEPVYNSAIDKKHFLMRQLNNGYISEQEYKEKVAPLEIEIKEFTAKRLQEAEEEARKNFHVVKQTVPKDGDMKRAIARLLIKHLESDFSVTEIKGISRQMYKIARTM